MYINKAILVTDFRQHFYVEYRTLTMLIFILKVPHKFRYPFYNEVSWYVLARYLNCLTGKNYLEKPALEDDDELSPLSNKLSKVATVELTRVDDEDRSEARQSRKSSTESNASESSKVEKKKSRETSRKSLKQIHLTEYELTGLEKLIEYLEELPDNKKSVPKDMKDPQKVLADMKVRERRNNCIFCSKLILTENIVFCGKLWKQLNICDMYMISVDLESAFFKTA